MKRGVKICLFSLVFMFIFAGRKIMVMKGYMNRLVWMALVLGIVAELEEDEV